jgi:hypothetical protein
MGGKMEAEEVVAFINEAVPYAKRGDDGKLEWCRRVKKVLASGWKQVELAKLLGIDDRRIRERLAWSEADSGRRRAVQSRETQRKRLSHARQVMRDLDITPETKADLIAEAQADPHVQQVLQRRLREKGGAPPVQPAKRRLDTRFVDGLQRATDGLDLALTAARDGQAPEGAQDMLPEISNRIDAITRVLGGASREALRRVK